MTSMTWIILGSVVGGFILIMGLIYLFLWFRAKKYSDKNGLVNGKELKEKGTGKLYGKA